MTIAELPGPVLTDLVRVRTRETRPPRVLDDACVPTRSDWPQDEFLAWLDAYKRRKRIRSDYQLAAHLGIGHTLISGWRNGRQKPSIETLNRVAAVTGDDPRELWVLAGAANASDVGLLGERQLQTGPDLPVEFEELIALYGSAELTDADRAAVLRHVDLLRQGILADLERRRDGQTVRRTRAS